MKKYLLIPMLILGVACNQENRKSEISAAAKNGVAAIDSVYGRQVVEYLAADSLFGRWAGTEHNAKAANYIVSELQKIGASPFFGNDYFQPFEVYTWEKQGYHYMCFLDDSLVVEHMKPTETVELRNVLAKIEGERADEYVVIGAHYDHIGCGRVFDGDSICNGADDNASGVSAVLQTAKAVVASGKKPLRTIIFAFWDAEEQGLIGSQYFVKNHEDINKIKAYINLDMIGRNSPDTTYKYNLMFFYTKAKSEYKEWLSADIDTFDLKLNPEIASSDEPYMPSDNAPFVGKKIPIIYYSTGVHPDYHNVGDESQKINYTKMADISKSAFLILWRIANE